MKITVNWTIKPSGEQVSDQFPVKAPLHAVKHIVLASAEAAGPSDAGSYVVKDMSGNQLDESKSLEELGVNDGDRLILEQA